MRRAFRLSVLSRVGFPFLAYRATVLVWILVDSMLSLEERVCRLEDKTVQQEQTHSRLQKKDWRLGIKREQLLPPIFDEITLHKITTKLPWNEFHVFTSLNRSWHHAVSNHLVYQARVQCSSTESFLLFMAMGAIGASVLYGLKDKSIVKLPPIPSLHGEIKLRSESIAIDGKLYAFEKEFHKGSNRLFVLDLAGRRQWSQCASMQEPRANFSFRFGVLGGKIYVFGVDDFGANNFSENYRNSEVYDPEKNTWCSIKPMLSPRCSFTVEVMGDILLIYGGFIKDSNGGRYGAKIVEIYRPSTDEWRLVESIPCILTLSFPWTATATKTSGKRFAGSDGKFYFMDQIGVYVYNSDGSSLTLLHSNSFSAIKRFDSLEFDVNVVLVVDHDELFTSVTFWNTDSPKDDDYNTIFLRARGFGSEKEEIAWEEEDRLRDEEMHLLDAPVIHL